MTTLKEMLDALKKRWEENLQSIENSSDYYYCKGALYMIDLIIILLPLIEKYEKKT